ncbi:glutathione-specific gamma-glutamylcyclotransferase 1-like [Lytechinus pictus]|uniref:glutathione-specific gamma-glutamylcyclotransferase 1-like n=1 Tax=Lytechinus pictus TaxID=7653 RepID=UPI0030BA064B
MAPQTSDSDNNVSAEEMMAKDCVWIFGYGSLIWHPNFEYTEKKIGYVKGYVTRFWQGSISHRGTPDKPGRVATMVEQKEGQAWGVVFKLEGSEQITKAFLHLNMRECLLGCYQVQQVTFNIVGDKDQSTVQAIAFRATPDNELFVGPDSVETAARIVASSWGRTGHNAEYLFRLVDFMHKTVPDAKDRYLFELEKLTQKFLNCKCSSKKSISKTSIRHKGSKVIAPRTRRSDQLQYYHKCYLSVLPLDQSVH